MFVTKKTLKRVILEALTGDDDAGTIRGLKEQIEDLKLKKKITEEDLEHMIVLAQEKRDIELEKEKIKLEVRYAEKAKDSLVSFHAKMEARFSKEAETMQKVYKEIIKRLPNVNVEMSR